MKTKIVFILILILISSLGLAQVNESSTIEARIRSGEVSTADLIVSEHPRLWLKGQWDWDYRNVGSFAWRIVHGDYCSYPCWPDKSWYDAEMGEFWYAAGGEPGEGGRYGADTMYDETGGSAYKRTLEFIIAGKAVQQGWQNLLPAELEYTPDHSADEYFAEARERLLYITDPDYNEEVYAVNIGSVAYDWLVSETKADGSPVLSDADKQQIQQGLIAIADELKSEADGASLFKFQKLSFYDYPMVGLALYEPSLVGDSGYAAVNAKAMEYLDDLDSIWVGKILPTWNKLGSDGGWHGGVTGMDNLYMNRAEWEAEDYVTPWGFVPLFFAHYTATGQPIERSLFNSPILRNSVAWQLYMFRPVNTPDWDNASYINVGEVWTVRTTRVAPMRMYARRRFSSDPEQQKIAELGGWIRHNIGAQSTSHGSWDQLDQLIFEDKWPNPRSPEELGFPTTRHFQNLGWVFMRTGFTSASDLVALFIAQPYRWSELDAGHSQGTFYLERKGKLIEGFNNIVKIDNEGQREITTFPTLDQGVAAYAPGSLWDVGPGIERFESGINEYDNIFADVTNAYDPNKLEKFTRHIVYLKPDKFIMLDRVITKSQNYKKSWIIDPGATPETAEDKLFVIKNGAGALWIKRLLPENATIESQTSDRFEVTPIQPANEDFFLHVFQAVDAEFSKDSPGVVADESVLLTNGDQMGVQVGEWKVWFNQDGEINVLKNDIPVSVKDRGSPSETFKLNQNYPNPFNPETTVTYTIPSQSFVSIKIYNLLGSMITTLISEVKPPGVYQVTWNGRDSNGEEVASGIYLYKIEMSSGNRTVSYTRKMILVR